MKNINYSIKWCIFVFVMTLLVQIQNSTAQIPVNDPAWIKDTTLSDDFNGTDLNYNKWHANDSVWDRHSLAMDFDRPNHDNVKVAGGTLTIHVDTLIPPGICIGEGNVQDTFYYQSGAMSSQDRSFKYGYLEIVAKFPTGNDAYWPAYWLWYSICSPNDTTSWYNEIDVAENGPQASLNGQIMGTNWHLFDTIPDSCKNIVLTHNPYDVDSLPLLSSD